MSTNTLQLYLFIYLLLFFFYNYISLTSTPYNLNWITVTVNLEEVIPLWSKQPLTLINGRLFWDISDISWRSWIWKHILKLRDIARPFLHCKIGNGNTNLFWHDNWTVLGPLIDLTGANGPPVTGINKLATIAQAMNRNEWRLPRGRHSITVLLRGCLPLISSSISITPDFYLWKNSNSEKLGQFFSSLTWSSLHPQTDLVSWWMSVWFTVSIPKHSFIMWLTMRDMLVTKDKLLSWGLQVHPDCVLCIGLQENRTHLFLFCTFSTHLLRALFSHHSFHPPPNLVDSFTWAQRATFTKRVKTICYIVLQAIVYELWKERNTRLHNAPQRTVTVIRKEIQLLMKRKLYSMDRLGNISLSTSGEDSYLYTWFGLFQFY